MSSDDESSVEQAERSERESQGDTSGADLSAIETALEDLHVSKKLRIAFFNMDGYGEAKIFFGKILLLLKLMRENFDIIGIVEIKSVDEKKFTHFFENYDYKCFFLSGGKRRSRLEQVEGRENDKRGLALFYKQNLIIEHGEKEVNENYEHLFVDVTHNEETHRLCLVYIAPMKFNKDQRNGFMNSLTKVASAPSSAPNVKEFHFFGDFNKIGNEEDLHLLSSEHELVLKNCVSKGKRTNSHPTKTLTKPDAVFSTIHYDVTIRFPPVEKEPPNTKISDDFHPACTVSKQCSHAVIDFEI